MPTTNLSQIEYVCDYPGCPQRETVSWGRPKGWVELEIGVRQGTWTTRRASVTACSADHAVAVALPRAQYCVEMLLLDVAGRQPSVYVVSGWAQRGVKDIEGGAEEKR